MGGAKPWEWRGGSYLDHRRYIKGPGGGDRILLHAAPPKVTRQEDAPTLRPVDARASSPSASGPIPLLRGPPLASWPLACGLGTAIIGAPISALEWARQHLKPGFDSDRIDHHKYAWPLTDLEHFEPMIPARGAQGFWNWRVSV